VASGYQEAGLLVICRELSGVDERLANKVNIIAANFQARVMMNARALRVGAEEY
jgi:hypothetical protein